MLSGSELFVRSLRSQGVDRLFTLVGDHLNDVLQAAVRHDMRVDDTRHESAAVHMADGWSRLTRTPSVSMVTGAPGPHQSDHRHRHGACHRRPHALGERNE